MVAEARKMPEDPDRRGEETPRDERGRIKWRDVRYPGVLHSLYLRPKDGANTREGEEHSFMCATEDSFEQVVAFYEKLPAGGLPKQAAAGAGKQPVNAREMTGEMRDDSQVPQGPDDKKLLPRPVKLRLFRYQLVPGGSFVIVVSRADGEKHTHILFSSFIPSR
jgi:hypothetical protein